MTHSDTKAWDPTTIMWQVYPLGFAGVHGIAARAHFPFGIA
ncbi:hypothetical protein [Corynebacterium belfantii]|nr:hypothetical protein [Corynebacterium belfantii]